MDAKVLLLCLALLFPAAAALPGLAPGPAQVPAAADVLRAVAAPLGPVAAPDLDALPQHSLREAIVEFYALSHAIPTAQGLAKLDASLAALPPEVAEPVARLLVAMNAAGAMRAEAFARVAPAELVWARDASLDLEAQDEAALQRLAGIAARIDAAKMVAAGALVLAAVERDAPMLRAAAELPGAGTLAFVDPSGSLEVTGTGNDHHAGDRTLLVDLGGDDTWTNNAGAMAPSFVIEAFPGCFTTGALDCSVLWPKRNRPAIQSLVGRPCSFNGVAPVFEANEYTAALNEAVLAADPAALAAFAQGAPAEAQTLAALTALETACLPQGPDDLQPWAEDFVQRGTLADGDAHFVTVGLDLSGDDRFAPTKSFNFMVNGANPSGCDTRAMGEAGKLWDRNVTAGSAFAGVGILWDGGGADFYGGRSITQGVGHLGGVGVLVDQGASDDAYEAIRFGQGVGFVAAAGLLYDDGGHDVYELKNLLPLWNEFESFNGCDVSTRDGQGRSNVVAVGALVDLAGDDRYFVQDHIAEGLYLPGASRDDPTTTQGSTGFRLNIGPSAVAELLGVGRGLLWDRADADTYSRPGRGNGCASTSGTFLDEGPSLLASLGPCPA